MMNTNSMTPADIAAVAGNNEFGESGFMWIILLFAMMFGWGGNGWGNNRSGVMDQYALNSDFATLSRQIDSQTSDIRQSVTSVGNGLCDGFYTTAQQINGVNQNIANGFAQAQLERSNANQQMQANQFQTRYDMQGQHNEIMSNLQNGFCQSGYNAQNNTRDIIRAQQDGTREILAALNQQRVEAMQAKIAEQQQMINGLQLAASQSMQNQYLINQLRPTPQPSYTVANPYTGTYGYGSCGCCN